VKKSAQAPDSLTGRGSVTLSKHEACLKNRKRKRPVVSSGQRPRVMASATKLLLLDSAKPMIVLVLFSAKRIVIQVGRSNLFGAVAQTVSLADSTHTTPSASLGLTGTKDIRGRVCFRLKIEVT
jgi:hypothetical protein